MYFKYSILGRIMANTNIFADSAGGGGSNIVYSGRGARSKIIWALVFVKILRILFEYLFCLSLFSRDMGIETRVWACNITPK